MPHQNSLPFLVLLASSSLKAKPTSKPIKGVQNSPTARTTHIPVLSSFLDKRTTFKIQKTSGRIIKASKNIRTVIPRPNITFAIYYKTFLPIVGKNIFACCCFSGERLVSLSLSLSLSYGVIEISTNYNFFTSFHIHTILYIFHSSVQGSSNCIH